MSTMTTEDEIAIGAIASADYLAAYYKRAEAGVPTAWDRANAAYAEALIASGRVCGDEENVEMSTIISARLLAKRARSAANLAARFQAEGRIAAAERCATFAQDRVAEIRAINPAKFDADPGIVPAFADGRKGAITRKGDNTQYN